MSNLALYIEQNLGGYIAQSENVLFDNILFSTGFIDYNLANGEITLTLPGKYTFQWWVAAQSSPSSNGVSFTLVSSGSPYIGHNTIKTGQTSGFGIVEVADSPVTVYLRNDSPNPVYYSSIVNTKAALLVTADVLAYGALMTTVGDFSLDGITTVPLTIESDISRNVDYSVENAITIVQDGVYRVEATVVTQALQESNLTLYVNKNGTPIDFMSQTLTLDALGEGTFSLTNYVPLAAGDILTLSMASTEAGTIFLSIFGVGAILSVQQIS